MREWVIAILAFIIGVTTSAAIAGATLNVRMGAIERQVERQRETITTLTVRSTRMEEQRDAQREAFDRWADSVGELAKSQRELVIAITKFDGRLGGLESEVSMLRRSFRERQ